jgi:hypothetical protein
MKTARRRCASAIVPVQITSDAATEQSESVGDSVEVKKQKIEG